MCRSVVETLGAFNEKTFLKFLENVYDKKSLTGS